MNGCSLNGLGTRAHSSGGRCGLPYTGTPDDRACHGFRRRVRGHLTPKMGATGAACIPKMETKSLLDTTPLQSPCKVGRKPGTGPVHGILAEERRRGRGAENRQRRCVCNNSHMATRPLENEASHNEPRMRDAQCMLSQSPCGDVADRKQPQNPIKSEAGAGRGTGKEGRGQNATSCLGDA